MAISVGAAAAVIVVLAICSGTQAGLIHHYPDDSTLYNKFLVKWTVIPDGLFETLGFYEMPRTISAAEKDSFTQAADRTSIDNTTVWCREDDYRVCVLFCPQGSVAGIMSSVSLKDTTSAGVPSSYYSNNQWFEQTLLGTEVYSTIAYFVDAETLASGGRTLEDSTATAPNGIRILETGTNSLSSLDVSSAQSSAEAAGFTEQNCFVTMGKHYFYNLTSSSDCDTDQRPYFTLYGKKTAKMLGFGVLQYGSLSTASRSWYEQPGSAAIKLIAPNRPDCLLDWVADYTLNTMHVFFVAKPWNISCWSLL